MDSVENPKNEVKMSKGDDIYYFRKTFESELLQHKKQSLLLRGLFQFKEISETDDHSLSTYLAFIFKPILLFYDEDLKSLSLFLPYLQSCKFLWMRINIGDYGCTELHASEEGFKYLREGIKSLKQLEGLYIFFSIDNWNWEWKSRIKLIEEEIQKFKLELGNLRLIKIEYSFGF